MGHRRARGLCSQLRYYYLARVFVGRTSYSQSTLSSKFHPRINLGFNLGLEGVNWMWDLGKLPPERSERSFVCARGRTHTHPIFFFFTEILFVFRLVPNQRRSYLLPPRRRRHLSSVVSLLFLVDVVVVGNTI